MSVRAQRKSFHELAVAALWMIAILTTAVLVGDSGAFSYLAPVYAVCMIGSIVTVRRSRMGGRA